MRKETKIMKQIWKDLAGLDGKEEFLFKEERKRKIKMFMNEIRNYLRKSEVDNGNVGILKISGN